MGRNLGLVVALSLVGCAAGSKSADQSPSSGATGGSVQKDDEGGARDVESTAAPVETTTGAAPPPDLTPKGGGAAESAPRDTKPADTKELGRSNAALGTTDHGELFEQLAVKVASAKLGTKDSAELNTAVASKTTDLDACYATARKADAALKGTIELTLTIEPDGTVSAVTIKKAKSKPLAACVKDVVKLVKLDKPLVATKTKATVVIAFGS